MIFVLQTIFCTGAMMLIIALVGEEPSQPPTDLSDHSDLHDHDT